MGFWNKKIEDEANNNIFQMEDDYIIQQRRHLEYYRRQMLPHSNLSTEENIAKHIDKAVSDLRKDN